MLRITKQADYALVLLSQFAVDAEGSIHTARGLSGTSQLPLPTVSKILKCLARNGLLSSIRGVNGGYRLARAAAAISVADVIGAVDGPIAFTDCLTAEEPGACQLQPSCPTRGHWGRINRVVADALTRLPLAEVARTQVPTPKAHVPPTQIRGIEQTGAPGPSPTGNGHLAGGFPAPAKGPEGGLR